MFSLYIVATPIGNLEDITLRALRILKEVKLIAAEDTRSTRTLLARYGVKTPLTSYHEHNKKAKLAYLLNLLQTGDVALVSEAGMPGMSDPGYELITACIQQGIPVVPIPGPSAILTALVVSGLPTDQFIYIGFLPRRKGERQRLLASLSSQPRTLIVLETPHRLQAALADMQEVLGDRKVAICRELTKLHEEVFRGTISQARQHFAQPRGEFTLVVAGQAAEEPTLTPQIEKELQRLKRAGVPARQAIGGVAQKSGLSRRELYRTWLKLG